MADISDHYYEKTGGPKHGSPEDRGSSDRYYGRPYNPHWHWYSDHGCQVVESEHMTVEEIGAYNKGWHEETGNWQEPDESEAYSMYEEEDE